MQGIILLGFRRFVRDSFGDALWRRAQESTGSTGRIYLPVRTYSHHELIQLAAATSKLTDNSTQTLLEGFGAFLAPDLLRIYATLIDPRWKLIDILANADYLLHHTITLQRNDQSAPVVRILRKSTRDVLITLISRPQLCAMVKGVIRGIAVHLGESVQILESSCILLRQHQCDLIVKCHGAGTSVRRWRTLPPPGASRQPPTLPPPGPGASIPPPSAGGY